MTEILPAVPLRGDYAVNPDFSDDFEGRSLDRSKWVDFYADWKGRAAGFFSPDNVRVEDGMLKLTARDVPAGSLTDEQKEMGFEPRSSAIIRSRKKILYGCFQTEFRTMHAAVCNAFWLNDPLDTEKKHRPGSFSDEIDMFEVFGKSPNGIADTFFTTCHRMSTPYMEGRIFSGNTRFTNRKAAPKPFSFARDFHTATFLWTPDHLEWYLDGQLEFRHPNDYYHSPMRLNVDCEFMPGWCGRADSADLPSDFLLRYIRVWQTASGPAAHAETAADLSDSALRNRKKA